MGYSRSIATVEKRRHILAPLFSGEARIEWQRSIDEAPKLARAIRECFHIARLKPRELPELARISARYEIRVEYDKVIAVRRGNASMREAESIKEHLIPQIMPIATASPQIIQAWLDYQPSNAPLEVERAMLTEKDFGELVRWAGSLEPAWEVIGSHKGKITVRPEVR